MAALARALHVFVILFSNHICGKPNYWPTSFQDTLDPVGSAIVSCHNTESCLFGLETILSQRNVMITSHLMPDHVTSTWRQRKQNQLMFSKETRRSLLLLLILSGDIAPNPGPIRNPCGMCEKPVRSNQRALLCDLCEIWFHLKCLPDSIAISNCEYDRLGCSTESWYCFKCLLPQFSDSFFQNTSIESTPQHDMSTSSHSSTGSATPNSHRNQRTDPMETCSKLRTQVAKNALLCHLNINSLRHKIHDLRPFMHKLQPVLFSIQETKIDDSFPSQQFSIQDYHPAIRADRNIYGGGTLVYIRSDIPFRQLKNFCSDHVESLFIEIFINKKPWIVGTIYRPPSLCDQYFTSDMELLIDKALSLYDDVLLIGDMNYDFMVAAKRRPLANIMEQFSLSNMIKTPTFTSAHGSSLLDVALTNSPNKFLSSHVIDIGISDGHSVIAIPLRTHLPHLPPRDIIYRSFKTFNAERYAVDVASIPFSVAEVFDDPDDMLWAQSLLLKEVLDDHAPMKKKRIRSTQPPFMNTTLRKAIYRKTNLHNRFLKGKCSWEEYRRQRNHVTNFRRKSVRIYFQERCEGGPKNSNFWGTIKPYISQKSKAGAHITLSVNQSLISDHSDVAEHLNSHYSSIANDISSNTSPLPSDLASTIDFVSASRLAHTDHPSVSEIRHNNQSVNFNFNNLTTNSMEKVIKNLNQKKPAGCDGIPAKALACVSTHLAPPMTSLFNCCVASSKFPDSCKNAVITPVFKKDDPLCAKNYRPVSVLGPISKILERCIDNQLRDFLKTVFHPCLSAFRAGHSCQHVLIHLCETWRKALDEKKSVGILLVDLSKAFDCLPHSLVVAKLEAYGLSEKATTLLADYLINRKQCVKVGDKLSSWKDICYGVPQGSILGPVLFNLFINDIFTSINEGSLFNYADDNTILVTGDSAQSVRLKLKNQCTNIMNWVTSNEMAANEKKFQIMLSDNDDNDAFVFNDVSLTPEHSVKLLGVTIDSNLKFNEHISNLCIKASRQINVLMRLKRNLDFSTKLLVYKSFILCHFNYCPLVWHECGADNTRKLERLQYRALRFVFNEYNATYEELLAKAKMPTLSVSRIRSIALETYKALNNSSPSYICDLFKSSVQSHSYNLRRNNLIHSTCRTSHFGLKSFTHVAINIWNSLPNEIRCTSDFKIFKSFIYSWSGPKCNCNFCKT